MSKLNCHSAYQHYEMFHWNDGGGSINIGSNNNTIFQCNGGHGGGFWKGFGYGLGQSLFGGLFGGGMGFGFPSFGFSSFGMGGMFGGFGMGMGFGSPLLMSLSSLWGAKKQKVKDKEIVQAEYTLNKDRANIDALADEKYKLGENATPEQKAKFNKKITDAIAAQTVESCDIDDFDKARLEALKYTIKPLEVTPVTTQPVTTPVVTSPVIPEDDNAKNINNAKNLDDLKKVSYDELSDDDKKAYLDKTYELLEALDANDDNKKTERTAIKAEIARIHGYTNYDGKTAISKANMKLVHDTGLGDNADIVNYVAVTPENGIKPTEIKMKTSNSKSVVTYTFVDIIDGEYIYKSDKKNQFYALQKKGEEFHLVQYKYHNGCNIPDVS